jgi:hypothetical protein
VQWLKRLTCPHYEISLMNSRCSGFDVQPVKQPEGVTRCASLAELLSQPLDTLFITTASLHHLEVLEQALASPGRVLWSKNRLSPRFPKLKN